jgi:lipopolysaccharide exporter
MGGVIWTLAATAAGRILTFAALAVLARLLAPADFGLMAFALVYITYVETVGDLGTGAALIYWPAWREDAAQMAFVLNVAMGAFWFAVTMLGAPAVAAFFGNPAGADILTALAWTFPLKALGNTHDALCQKDLRFKARLAPELGMAVVKGVVSVAAASAGLGVWSLVWGQLAGTAAWTALLWRVVPWRPRLRWPADLFAPMLAYGRGIVAVNLLAAVVHHADAIVVGRMLGASALGLYHVAYKVPEAAIIMVMWAVSRVLFPALARARAEGRAPAETYLAALRYTSLFTVPASITVALLAEPLVLVLFGAPWAAATPILSVLAISAGLRSLGNHAGDVLKAAGRPGLLAALAVVRALVLVPALVVAARWGAVAVAATMAVVTGATLTASVIVAGRVAHIPLRAVWRAMRGSVVTAAVVGAALWAWTWIVGPATDAVSLGLAMGVAAMTYFTVLKQVCPEALALISKRRAPGTALQPARVRA